MFASHSVRERVRRGGAEPVREGVERGVNDGINNYSQIQNASYDLAGRLASFQMLTSGYADYSSYCDCWYYIGLAYQTQSQTYNANGQLASIG